MLLINKMKKIFLVLLFSLISVCVFSVTTDLSERFLDKANESFENGNIEDAYKYVNQALAVAKDEESQANVLFFARNVYVQKLKNIQENYDEMSLIEIQMNLEKYPNIENNQIKKILKQIETEQKNLLEEQRKADVEKQRQIEQERFETQQEQMEAQASAMKEFAQNSKEQSDREKERIEIEKQRAEQEKLRDEENKKYREEERKNSEELKQALSSGFQGFESAFTETAKETKRSTTVLALSILLIAFIIFIVVALIIVIVRKGFRQQQVQQENYVNAFKLLAANQNQTNRLMLGGVTDLYGSNAQLKIAGSSTWAPSLALPDIEFTENDEEELKQLAVKCEEIGSQIDAVTGRKNNSKNVSELVYKLSSQLGLPQPLAMLNFCAAMIYDAGFLGVNHDLFTATTLNEEEKQEMKGHVSLAEKQLSFVPKKYWEVFENAAMKHHENIDGSGYPNGLKGDEIPQIARLIRVAESYISLSSKRSYRGAMDKETAVETLKSQPQFYDMEVVEALDQIV